MKAIRFLPISLVLITICIFYARLFLPVPSLVVTPDFGKSDAWHFSFPTKFALSQALKVGQLPLWRVDVGGGFPLFAEGQTGALFAPNVLIFSLFSPVEAYNFALVLAILMLAIGMYCWCKTLGFDPWVGAFAALTISFSGLTIAQLPHITLLQSISMTPFVALSAHKISKNPTLPWVGWFALALSQQIYTGFPQVVFLTLLLCAALFLFETRQKLFGKEFLCMLAAFILGVLGGAAQLLPSYEILQQSTNPEGFDPSTASQFSMPLKHLLSFVTPFALGNPQFGTYPPFFAFDGSIFWENTTYIGLLPLLLVAYGWFTYRNTPWIKFLYLCIAASLILAWGKHAPSYIVYSFWPLTLFRVPSRFLWICILLITLLTSFVLQKLLKKYPTHVQSIMGSIIVLIQCISLVLPWWNYHALEPAGEWLKPPSVFTQKDTQKILTVGAGSTHNSYFLDHGWENKNPYKALRENLAPNSNILWGVTQAEVYAGRFLERQTISHSLLTSSLQTSPSIATVSSSTFLNQTGVTHILSHVPIHGQLRLERIATESGVTLHSYSNPDALPRARIVYEATTSATLSKAVGIMSSTAFDPKKTVFVEKHDVEKNKQLQDFLSQKSESHESVVDIKKQSHTSLHLSVNTSRAGILVLQDTFYPGWIVTVNGDKQSIFAANISQRAVLIPKGISEVIFEYNATYLPLGSGLSLISYAIIIALIIAPLLALVSHILPGVSGRGKHRRYNQNK